MSQFFFFLQLVFSLLKKNCIYSTVLAWDRGIKLLVVEVDSLCVTQLLQRRDDVHNACYPLVKGI